MRTRKLRRRLSFVVIAELTVATQFLTLLPPRAEGARPAVVRGSLNEEAESAGHAAGPSEPAPQEPLTVNRTVPESEPPPAFPAFSSVPTDEEIIKARVFGEPLIPEAGESDDAENQALAPAITASLSGGDSEALEPLEGLVTNDPSSRWRVAVQANVGSWYRKKGYFTRAQRNLSDAWRLGKESTTDGVRRLAEFAAGELMILHMQFGQVEPLEAVVAELESRALAGGVTETLAAAKSIVWSLRNDHANAIPSGAVALERVRLERHEKAERAKKVREAAYRARPFQRHPEIDRFPASHDGASLSEIHALASRSGLDLQMAKRESTAASIPLPAVIHLKQGHFAALIEERGQRFRLDDPLLGGEVWMSREAFDEETSGYFLIESGELSAGWRRAQSSEAASIRGKCLFAVPDTRGTRRCDPKSGGCGNSCSGSPMAQYAFHLGAANLSIFDTPVGYSPPIGPGSYFQATYNHRESTQPSAFTYSNLGARWTFDWLSFIEDDPTALGQLVDLYARGGGREGYDGFVNGVSKPQQDVRAVLTLTSADPIVYERESPDGSVEVYSLSDNATSPRRVFLKEWRDPQGNKLTFNYDADLRMTSVQDAIGQVTTLSYDLATDESKITKVTDPFGRSATFEYDSAGRLVRIVDVIGIRSEFEYGSEDFVLAMTTPYGRTTFKKGSGPYQSAKNMWLEATDPLGGTERLELLVNNAPLPQTDPPSTVPVAFTDNSELNTHISVYYGKLVMGRSTMDPPDPNEGEITRWRSSPAKLSGYQVHSKKLPLENRVWYGYQGEPNANGISPDGRPSKIGRVLDDGTSQIHRYEYGPRGNVTRSIDPRGRETVYEYSSNQTDLLRVKQRNGTAYELLQEMTYNGAHQPLAAKDASGKTTSYTYNSEGQVLTITTPQRAGITEIRTSHYVYDANGHLQSVTGPAPGATTLYTYDGFGRTRTVTDSDEYTLTFDYDDLDRQVKTTYPDGTFEETAYSRLDPSSSRDRLGRWTSRVYDALRRVTATRDPQGRTVSQVWCSCGSLDALIDANGNRTEWERDLQGRVTKEVRANGSEWLYEYEDTTSRLERVTDPNGQHKDYEYFLDGNLQSVSYPNPLFPTPSVSFTYDIAYNRVKTMVDGTGTTTYGYHAIGQNPPLGAGRLASVDGPLANDTITYGYDELGRVASRAIDGVALTYAYDALGRIQGETNALGIFGYEYDGVTSRLNEVTYPNGQTTSYAYYPNSGDHRLQEIHHRKPGAATLSKFNYAYDVLGNIQTWTQQQDADPAKAYDFGYDRADQLRTAVWRTTDSTPVVLKRYGYSYDPAGNRTVEQIDDAPVLSAYDNMNRLLSQVPGGTLRFAGTLNEEATVTVQGKPATVSSTEEFEGGAEVGSGTSQVVVKAKDYSGNERTNTYEVSVSGSSKAFTFDDNGNMTGDGTRTFEWDAENRLLAVNQGTLRSEFTYDGLKRRVRLVEKVSGVVQSDKRVLWCERAICEERDASGATVVRRAFGLGEQIAGAAQFFAKDHLGSVTEVTNSGGALLARYTFDPWGRRTLAAGTDVTTVGFTGHRWQANGEISLALHRAYDAHSGNWLSQDPIGLAGGPNFYAYTFGNPVRFVDPLGLEITCSWGARYVYNVPRTNCDPLEGCTTPRFQRDIGECEEECGKWKFDGWIRVTFVIEFSVSPDLPAKDAPGFPPGITLWEHEQIHKWDFVDWCGSFKNYPSEGFSSPAECNQARENLINSIESTFYQPKPHDHN